ncbi:AAA family ATPase [Actinomadura luteofluorescens]|uniref:nSTAND1 domain-containing NTPase n=1 Tax=Actinomadura luteofluorescens TaxID=46163 RepID=UPI003499B00F
MRSDCPWIGVRAFGPTDAGRFFGRSREITELAALWRGNRLVVLTGDSGTGKTSLVRAGVIRRLADQGANVLSMGSPMPGPDGPAAADFGARNVHTFALLTSWCPDEPAARLSELSIRDMLLRQEKGDRLGKLMPTLVAIDHLPRIVATAECHEEGRGFLAELAEALVHTRGVHILITARTEEVPELSAWLRSFGPPVEVAVFDLETLDRDDALEVLSSTMDGSVVQFAPRAVAGQVLDELAEAGRDGPSTGDGEPTPVEPVLLQIVMVELWERLSGQDTFITPQMVPDVELALARYCARVVGSITSDHDLPTCEVGTWLRKAFVTSEGEARTISSTDRPEEMTEGVIRALEDNYLIRSFTVGGAVHHTLRHACLARALRRVGEVGPGGRQRDPRETLAAAEVARSSGDLALARRYALSAARSSDPRHLRVQAHAESLLGRIAHEQGWPEVAERHYRVAGAHFERLQDVGESGRLLATIGRLKIAQGDHAGALRELNNAARRAANDPHVQIGLALVFWADGRIEAAIAELNRALRDTGASEARQLRGEINADRGEAEAALRDLDRSGLHSHPAARMAWVLASALRSPDRFTPGDLEEIVVEAPDNGLVLWRAARICELRGDAEGAAAYRARAERAATPPMTKYHRRRMPNTLQPPPRD